MPPVHVGIYLFWLNTTKYQISIAPQNNKNVFVHSCLFAVLWVVCVCVCVCVCACVRTLSVSRCTHEGGTGHADEDLNSNNSI